jgi:hypothetical protein
MSLEKKLISKMRSQRRFRNLRFKLLGKISKAQIHGIFAITNLIVLTESSSLWLLLITLSLWMLTILIKKRQMSDIVSEVMSAKTSKEFKKLSENYNLKMTKEFKQDMQKLDKLSKKAKKSS